jgi:hypothetical protein
MMAGPTRHPAVRVEAFSFGSITIDGETFEHDVVVDRGRVRTRRKQPSKAYRDAFGHTPLSADEEIPWECRRLIVGTGAAGSLPVMDQVRGEAARRRVELLTVPTREAIEALEADQAETNAILHVTC